LRGIEDGYDFPQLSPPNVLIGGLVRVFAWIPAKSMRE
jgi:hypothetical protein